MSDSLSRIKKNFDLLNDDIIPNGVRIETFSNKQAIIEGCKGILEYNDDYIKINIGCGFVLLSGKELYAHSFSQETIVIKGKINTIEYSVGKK